VKLLLLVAAAALCFAASEPRVSRANLLTVESSMNEKFNARIADSYDLLGPARGTYLEGYGALFTFEVDLVNAGGLALTPFRPRVTPAEMAVLQERKSKKLPELRDAMRGLMVDAGTALAGMPANEHIAMEAILFSYSWEENTRQIPRRILMSAQRQKLLDARMSHATPAELAALIDEQDK